MRRRGGFAASAWGSRGDAAAGDVEILRATERTKIGRPLMNERKSSLDGGVGPRSSRGGSRRHRGLRRGANARFGRPTARLRERREPRRYVVGILWLFLGLAHVCDVYLEASLEGICEGLDLSMDVAGATFMAAGGSAPELCTSFIGVFVMRSDIGFGTIVGSAVFNVLFVIAACAHVAPNLTLTWWPLARDCACYCACIYAMVIVLANGRVAWSEAFGLLIGYGCYVFVMAKNDQLERYVTRRLGEDVKQRAAPYVALQKVCEHNAFAAVVYCAIVINVVFMALDYPLVDLIFVCFFCAEMALKLVAYGFFGYWKEPLNTFDGVLVALMILENVFLGQQMGVKGLKSLRLLKGLKALRFMRLVRVYQFFRHKAVKAQIIPPSKADLAGPRPTMRGMRPGSMIRKTKGFGPGRATARGTARLASPTSVAVDPGLRVEKPKPKVAPAGLARLSERKEDEERAVAREAELTTADGGGDGDGGGDDDDDDGAPGSWAEVFSTPDGGAFDKTCWVLMLPLAVLFYATIPDCGNEKYAKWYHWPRRKSLDPPIRVGGDRGAAASPSADYPRRSRGAAAIRRRDPPPRSAAATRRRDPPLHDML